MLALDSATFLEAGLLLLAIAGIIRHAHTLWTLVPTCRGSLTWSDEVFCRIYTRHETVRLGVKSVFAFIAFWMLTQPTFVRSVFDEWGNFGSIMLRVGLIAIVYVLDWESSRANEDRQNLQRTLRAIAESKLPTTTPVLETR